MMQRRQFMQTIVAASTCVATGEHVVAQTPAGRAPIKIGQIGTKHAHAAGQAATLRKLQDHYQLVGVVEPDEERRRRVQNQEAYHGLKWLTQAELLSQPGLQAMAVETEVADLLHTAQNCIDAGLHVHLDKPAGESFGALEKLHAAAERQNLVIQMGYMYRYNPAFQFLFKIVRDGWLGKVFEVHGVMSKTVGAGSRKALARYPGGSMFELGCHLIDPLLHLLGPPDRVTGYVRHTRPDQDSLADNILAVFEYPQATATIRSALVEVDGMRRRQFVVCGDEGTLVIRPLEPPSVELTLSRARGDFKKGTQRVELPQANGRYDGELLDMARVIRGEKEHEFSHEHDLAVQRALLEACQLSLCG